MKRTFIALGLVLLMLILLLLGARNSMHDGAPIAPSHTPPVSLEGTTFEAFHFPDSFDVRQYAGTTLNFIVENNLSANILSMEVEEFTKLTGINIKIRPTDYDTFIQKINLDFISESGAYQLIYCDPYQTLNRFHTALEPLNAFTRRSDLPSLQMQIDDFYPSHLKVCAYFGTSDTLYAIPFDSTTMIFYYREDVFTDFRDAFYADKGYDWTPGGPDFTWERYAEIAAWIDTYVPNEIVEYGSGQMAQEHNSIFCEFSNILASNGGDYFRDENIGTYGLSHFTKPDIMSDIFIESLTQYKAIVANAAPQSSQWNWEDTADAFSKGKIAMMTNWDENFTALNTSKNFRVRGHVGTALLPRGAVRSANIYGGSGIGINRYATDLEKEAAWFFITWATSPELQMRILTASTGGALPTIQSAYARIPIDFRLKHPQIETVLRAWQPENTYLRPKLEGFYPIEHILTQSLHQMITEDLEPEDVALQIHEALRKMR